MWAVLIVPKDKELQVFNKGLSVRRHQRKRYVVLFERKDKPLNNGDAAMLSDRSESRADFVMPAPFLEIVIPELRTFIANNIFWIPADPGNTLSQEMAYLQGRRSLFPDGDAHNPA